MTEATSSTLARVRAAQTDTSAAAARFGSLGAMRCAHRELLKQRSNGGHEFDKSIGLFLAKGSALGRILGAEVDRDDAQSMLDYWTASLCSEGHKAVDATLEDFDPAEAQRIAQQVERTYESLPVDQQQALRTVLLRLVRTSERLQVGKSEPVRVETLYRLGLSPEAAARAIEQGESLGLLYRSPGATPEEDQLEIASEAVLHSWPRFEQWQHDDRDRLARRRQLTAAARLWVSHGRDPGSLLAGAALAAVTQYHELSPLEAEFIQASQQFTQQRIAQDLAEARKKVFRIGALATACAVLAVVAAAFAWMFRHEKNVAEQQRRRAEEQNQLISDLYLLTLVLSMRSELRLSPELFERFHQEKLKYNSQQRAIIESYRLDAGKLKDRERQGYLKPSPTAPGLSIGVQDYGSAGSVCCVLEEENARRFVLTSGHLFVNLQSAQDESETTEVWQPSPVDGPGNHIGELKASYTASAALAILREDVVANNELPEGMGKIVAIKDVRKWTAEEWAAVPEGKDKIVHVFGCGAGYQIGRVTSPIRDDSYLFRVENKVHKGQPVSSPGDAGAPVLIEAAEGKFILIGMVYRKAEGGKESLVLPIGRVFEEIGNSYRLLEDDRRPKSLTKLDAPEAPSKQESRTPQPAQ